MMSEILGDLSPTTLANAVEANLFDLFTMFRYWRRAELHDDSDKLWSITDDVPFPLVNSVLRAQFAPDNIGAAIESAAAPYKSKNLPILWWTGPATQPVDLGTYLEAQGFVHDDDSPGMAVDLQIVEGDPPAPPGFVIEQVAETETLREWCHTNVLGFDLPDYLSDVFLSFYSDLGFNEPPLINYIGRLNGEPVATSTLFLAAGVAGIYNVATLPDARGRGIGAAITCRPLLEARAMGYKAAILQSSHMGFNVYRKLGFQQVCTIDHYVWQAEPTSNGAD